MEQKSAEAIVDKDSTTDGSVVAGNEPGSAGMDSPCRRAELEEGDVIPHELRIAMTPDRASEQTAGASWRIQLPEIIPVAAVFSKNRSYRLTGYGPSLFGNRLVRTRMPGGVEAGGEKPPAIRLAV